MATWGQQTDSASQPPGGDPLIGRTIGRFVVEKKIGEGGMGAVYRLLHLELPDTYQALKVLTLTAHGSPAGEREILERFLQEAHAAAAVGSHRVVQIFDVGQLEDGTRYLLMEYVRGRSVAAALEARGPLPVLEAVLIAARVADTLAIAHQRGIIHRDIKPANLMLLSEGRDPTVKLLDFGIARATGEAKLAHTTERRIIGSPGYMSPEAVIGAAVDGRADVFSLAATLFEMLAGRTPFGGGSVNEAMMNTIALGAPSVSSLRPRHIEGVPPFLEALIAAGLGKNPVERPAMAEFQAALVAATDALAGAQRGGPVGASVMRTPALASAAQRPTLSAGAAEMSALLARYGPAAQETRPVVRDAKSSVPEAALPDIAESQPPERGRAGARAAGNDRGGRVAMMVAAAVVMAISAGTTAWVVLRSSAPAVPGRAAGTATATPTLPAEPIEAVDPRPPAPRPAPPRPVEPKAIEPSAERAPPVDPPAPAVGPDPAPGPIPTARHAATDVPVRRSRSGGASPAAPSTSRPAGAHTSGRGAGPDRSTERAATPGRREAAAPPPADGVGDLRGLD